MRLTGYWKQIDMNNIYLRVLTLLSLVKCAIPKGLMTLSVFCSAVIFTWSLVMVPSARAETDKVDTAGHTEESTISEQTQSVDVKTMDDQELATAASQVRSALIKARVDAQTFRYSFEVENEQARQLISEITDLQNQVVEKSKKLDVLLSEQESYGVLSVQERELVVRLAEINAEIIERADKSRDENK